MEKAAMIGFVKLRILEPDDQCVLRGDRLKEAMMEDIESKLSSKTDWFKFFE